MLHCNLLYAKNGKKNVMKLAVKQKVIEQEIEELSLAEIKILLETSQNSAFKDS